MWPKIDPKAFETLNLRGAQKFTNVDAEKKFVPCKQNGYQFKIILRVLKLAQLTSFRSLLTPLSTFLLICIRLCLQMETSYPFEPRLSN